MATLLQPLANALHRDYELWTTDSNDHFSSQTAEAGRRSLHRSHRRVDDRNELVLRRFERDRRAQLRRSWLHLSNSEDLSRSLLHGYCGSATCFVLGTFYSYQMESCAVIPHFPELSLSSPEVD